MVTPPPADLRVLSLHAREQNKSKATQSSPSGYNSKHPVPSNCLLGKHEHFHPYEYARCKYSITPAAVILGSIGRTHPAPKKFSLSLSPFLHLSCRRRYRHHTSTLRWHPITCTSVTNSGWQISLSAP